MLPRTSAGEEFNRLLASADVILHPFPFGGSKTAADGLALGKRMVGRDLHWPVESVRYTFIISDNFQIWWSRIYHIEDIDLDRIHAIQRNLAFAVGMVTYGVYVVVCNQGCLWWRWKEKPCRGGWPSACTRPWDWKGHLIGDVVWRKIERGGSRSDLGVTSVRGRTSVTFSVPCIWPGSSSHNCVQSFCTQLLPKPG